jgi:glycosyltransferase involved in cell wall biosynthesis
MNDGTGKPPFLILAYYYPPDAVSGAARPHRIAKYLSKSGHDVRVISAAPKSELGTGPSGNVYRVRSERNGAPERDMAGLVEWGFRKFLFDHDPGITWAARAAARALAWRSEWQVPVLFSTAPPLTPHLSALWLKIRHGWPWIADFRDPLAGNPFRPGWKAERTDPWFERMIFRYADAVIANTDAVADVWARRFPEWRKKIHVVWNGFDPDEAPRALPLPSGGPRTLTHVGVIYGDRDPLPVISAIREVIAAGMLDPRKFRVQLFGPMQPGSPETIPALENIAREGWLEIRNESIPRREAAAITRTSHYLLLLDVLGPKAGLQVPAKLFEYICVGRPILALTTRGSPLAGILARCGILHLCYYGETAPEVRARIAEFLTVPPETVQPSEWFQQNFNAASQADHIARIAYELCPKWKNADKLPLV